jgi:DNA-binding NarL/FixJ family response regulator
MSESFDQAREHGPRPGVDDEDTFDASDSTSPGACSALLKRRIDAASARWKLSTRQRQVLELLALGESNKVIAQTLGVAEVTVEAHVTSLLRKSGADSRTSLAVRIWAGAFEGLQSQRSNR